jgi:hypothetical protein
MASRTSSAALPIAGARGPLTLAAAPLLLSRGMPRDRAARRAPAVLMAPVPLSVFVIPAFALD